MNDFHQIAELSPISDAEASQFVSERTHADLVAAITSSTSAPSSAAKRARAGRAGAGRAGAGRAGAGRAGAGRAGAGRAGLRIPGTRRWVIAAPVVLGAAGAMLIATLVGRPGQHVGPISIGPANAKAALTFTRHGHYIDVLVRNPYADRKKYDAEFKAHGLNIKLYLVPASPSLADTVVYLGNGSGSTGIKMITAKNRCHTGGGGSRCPIGFRVPANFRGSAELGFGRPARPGEKYEATASSFAPGEALHGLRIVGHRIAAVLSLLRARHVIVAEYNHSVHHRGVLSRKVPLSWFVYDADPWAKGQVMLFVGKTRHPQADGPTSGTPVPTPSPTRTSH